MNPNKQFKNFKEFWPFYLSQHQHPNCQLLHFLGTGMAALLIAIALVTHNWKWLGVGLITGYGFAWAGHFIFEKNKPATFQYPLYSFLSDWRMFFLLIIRKKPSEW